MAGAMSLVLSLGAGEALAQRRGSTPRGGKAPPATAGKGGKAGEAPAASGRGLNSLTVACSTRDADVLIDGEPVGKAPIDLPVPVTNGNHTIRVIKPGFAPYIDVFKAVPGRPVKLSVELIPVAGVLRVSSQLQEVRVTVDGKYVGDAPVAVELEPGPHTVLVGKVCHKDLSRKVVAVAGEDIPLEGNLEVLPDAINPCVVKPLPPPKWYQKRWVWGVIAGGAVAVGGGITGIVIGPTYTDPLRGAAVIYNIPGR
ncbi:MAG TPA: PEGA domain-containing protein [Polyangia bacterium]|nr:PEGA domain-containing protein [Polyangia bacterium]